MSFFSLLFYDIKRLLGHGKTALIAILLPLPVVFLFAVFLLPMLSAGKGVVVSCALCNEDTNETLTKLLDLVINSEVEQGTAIVYPVKDVESGKRLVEEGRVAAFLHIPENTYQDSMNGRQVVLDYYYSPAHAFEALTFYTAVKSSLSVFGQGIRLVYVAGGLAMEHGLTQEDVLTLWREGTDDIIRIHMHRGKIIGSGGVFLPGADYHLRFAIALLFTVCAYFAAFPVMYLTSVDLTEILGKRSMGTGRLLGGFFARVLSGALLILCTFLILYPAARAIREVPFAFALSVLPAVFLIALTFSAFALFLGSLFQRGEGALWAGLYAGIVFFACVILPERIEGLPKAVSSVLHFSPVRACVSIFSNAMFKMIPERYEQDLLILATAFVVFLAAGLAAYMKRGRAL
ncbi:MAG: ABC transporter permease [Lachnospiraceae bacterium]|nr:ABC transporter permease [Lachnospiraceae bacterium]